MKRRNQRSSCQGSDAVVVEELQSHRQTTKEVVEGVMEMTEAEGMTDGRREVVDSVIRMTIGGIPTRDMVNHLVEVAATVHQACGELYLLPKCARDCV